MSAARGAARVAREVPPVLSQAAHKQSEDNQAQQALETARRRFDRHLRHRGIFMPHALFAPLPALPAGAGAVDGELQRFAASLVAVRESIALVGEQKVSGQMEAFWRRATMLAMTPAADARDFAGKTFAFEVLQRLTAYHFERLARYREASAAYAAMAMFARVLAGDALAIAEALAPAAVVL